MNPVEEFNKIAENGKARVLVQVSKYPFKVKRYTAKLKNNQVVYRWGTLEKVYKNSIGLVIFDDAA